MQSAYGKTMSLHTCAIQPGYTWLAQTVPYLFGYKMGLSLSRMSTNNQISPMQFCCYTGFTLPKQSKDLDPSYKMDLDFWDCFGRKKTPSYKRRNTVTEPQ